MQRREFLAATGAGAALAMGIEQDPLAMAEPASTEPPKKKLAIVTTKWAVRSHAWHMGERFLVGYPRSGHWHRPPIEVVSAYIDQTPANDLSRQRAEEFGFTIYPTIADALRCGGKQLAVDAVLIIGEHGEYPTNEIGQKLYPRFEFFKQVADVFEHDRRSVPVFNDKHLSWNWNLAKSMVARARELKFPFLAGSSLPVTWRMPAIDMPLGAEVDEVMCIAFGQVDLYDFHALEVIQCMAERRRGGETGVASVQALRGESVWQALAAKSWAAGGWDGALFESCLSRSHTLAQPAGFSHRYPSVEQMRALVKEPICYRFEYRDGLKATMLLLNGLVDDFTFAARIKNRPEPLSTLFHLPPTPNVVYSAALMSQAEAMFLTGRAPYPIERTLLTTGLVEAGMQSLATGKLIYTTHLDIKYQPPQQSLFWQD